MTPYDVMSNICQACLEFVTSGVRGELELFNLHVLGRLAGAQRGQLGAQPRQLAVLRAQAVAQLVHVVRGAGPYTRASVVSVTKQLAQGLSLSSCFSGIRDKTQLAPAVQLERV